MSELIVQIQTAQKQYRIAAVKEKNSRAKIKATVLTTLLGEIENKQKNSVAYTDEDVISLIKKFINGIQDTLKIRADDNLLIELDALNVFLPRQMSELEISQSVYRIIDSWKETLTNEHFGKIMGILKRQHTGLYDGAVASKIVKKVISGSV